MVARDFASEIRTLFGIRVAAGIVDSSWREFGVGFTVNFKRSCSINNIGEVK